MGFLSFVKSIGNKIVAPVKKLGSKAVYGVKSLASKMPTPIRDIAFGVGDWYGENSKNVGNLIEKIESLPFGIGKVAGVALAPVTLATHGGKLLQHVVHGRTDGIQKEGVISAKGLALRNAKLIKKMTKLK